MTESPQHKKAVSKLKDLVRALGGKVLENSNTRGYGGYEFPTFLTEKGPRQWTADVYAELKNGRRVIIEVDGKIGHSSQKAFFADNYRDRKFREWFGIITVRYNVDWVKDLNADMLSRDINWLCV